MPLLRTCNTNEQPAILAEVRPLVDAGDFDSAERKLIEVAELDPANREARRLRRAVREEVQRRAVAKRVAVLVEESEAQMKARQFAEAVQTLESARRLNSDDADVRARLSQAHSKLEAYVRANRMLAEARRDQQRGLLADAVDHLRSALEFDAQLTDAQILYARLDAELQKRERERRVEQAIAAASERMRAGRYEDALSVLGGVESERASSRRNAHSHRARAAGDCGGGGAVASGAVRGCTRRAEWSRWRLSRRR